MSRAASWNLYLLAILGGMALQLRQPALWPAAVYAGMLVAAIVLIAAQSGLTALSGKNTLKILILATAWAALAFASTGWRAQQRLAQALPETLARADVQLRGRVVDLPQRQGEDLRFLFAPASASYQGRALRLPPQLQLNWYANSNLALPPQGLQAGQVWAFTARLRPVHGTINPHGFDYEGWAFERGLLVTGYVRAADLLASAPTGWAMLAPQNWGSGLSRLRAASREAVFAQVADGRQAAVLAALLMGEQSVIERSDWDLFRATGVAHLMSISGLHITLFAWLAIAVLGRLWRCNARLLYAWPAQYAAWVGGLLLAAAYAAFTGWGVPAQRTVLMLALATLLRLSGRQWPWHFALLVVAVVVLAIDPWALRQPGFWLSFVAVAVLLLQNPGAEDELDPIESRKTTRAGWLQRRWLAGLSGAGQLLRQQLTISLALAPLSLLLFGQFSLVGVLANLLAIPLVTFVITPLTLTGLLFAPLWQLAAAALQPLLVFLEWCASWPQAVLHSAALPWWLGAPALAAVFLALVLRQQGAAALWRWGCLALALLLCGLALRYQPPRPAQGQFVATFVDVGQGNAVLIQTAKHSLLYDTGPRYQAGDASSNAGERVLLPLLRAYGLRPDVLIISHQDSDHSGGALPILQHLVPKQLLTSMPQQPDWPAQPAAQPCIAGQRWRWDGVDFEVLHPQAGDYARGLKSNAMSCVLRVGNDRHSVLLAGDIPEAQERHLWQHLGAGKLASTLLLAPHHGSKTSSNYLFLQAVAPRWVVVQAGYANRYGHPAPAVLQRYADLGLGVIGNAECGAVSWNSAQPQRMACLRRDAPRYWWQQLGVKGKE